MTTQAVQQSRTIRGHIVDENGEPMIGVTIMAKSGKGGCISDINGDFSLNVPTGTTLLLTYTGYKDKTVVVGKENEHGARCHRA